MLHLHAPTPERWLRQASENIEELLIDHAHCEKKAAGTAMNLLFAYVDNEELAREITVIVNEELEHFHRVLDLLKRRQYVFRRIPPSQYARLLGEEISKFEPQRAVDRLLIAGLIEARSCERFGLLHKGLPDRELADFYGDLFESEARHHATYTRLAGHFADEALVKSRLHALADVESRIIQAGEVRFRMHS